METEPTPRLTEEQTTALTALCGRYHVPFDAAHYWPQFDLPTGYVSGWVGGPDNSERTIYAGCSPEGEIAT